MFDVKRSAGTVATISLVCAGAVVLSAGSGGAAGGRTAHEPAPPAFGSVALSFEANLGQAPDDVRFLARSAGRSVYLTATGAAFALGPSADETVRMQLVGGDPEASVRGDDAISTKSNYFTEDARGGRVTGVPHYARVRYDDVYPGVDLVFHGDQRQLEYDFVVAPGVDTDTIRLRLEGADQLAVDDDGAMVAQVGDDELIQGAPTIYQELDGSRRNVTGGFELAPDGEIGFRVGSYDRTRPLIIDPVISYGSYLGGTSLEYGHDIAVGADGSAYVTGVTYSLDLPVTSPLQDAKAGLSDAFVAKLDPTGSRFEYVTYLGGGAEDTGWGIDVDAEGRAVVAGTTWSSDFPVSEGSPSGGSDAFVATLSPSGDALVSAHYLGGTRDDEATGVDVDTSLDVTVAGSTASADFPTLGAADDELGGGRDAFVSRFAEDATLRSSTFVGGSGDDRAAALATSAAGTYISGTTSSLDLAPGDPAGSFAAKLLPDLSGVAWATYLGDPAARTNLATGIALDVDENGYVPATTGAGGETGDLDIILTKLDPDGIVVDTTALRSPGEDYGAGVAVAPGGDVFLSGTASGDFGDFTPLPGGGDGSAFVAVLDPDLVLTYSSRFGGGGEGGAWGRGRGLALDGTDALYVTGDTSASDFPATGGAQPDLGGLRDAFVVKIDFADREPQPPQAHDDHAATLMGEAVTIAVLDNDTSTNGPLDPGSVEVVAPAASGTTAVEVSTGEIIYTPRRGFLGSDVFEYRVCAGSACAPATVFVEVEPPPCTLTVAPGESLVVGSRGDDVICGGDGDETILAQAGDDIVLGGGGDDVILGKWGDDVLHGGDGNDVISGDHGDDVLAGGPGEDILLGGSGDDVVIDGPGDDVVRLGQGDDAGS